MTATAPPYVGERRGPRRLAPFRLTVQHLGIIAQIESVVISGAKAHVAIAAAASLRNGPSRHDVANARICAYVVSEQPRFRSVRFFFSIFVGSGQKTLAGRV